MSDGKRKGPHGTDEIPARGSIETDRVGAGGAGSSEVLPSALAAALPLGRVVLAGAAAAPQLASKTQIADPGGPHAGSAVSVTVPSGEPLEPAGSTLSEVAPRLTAIEPMRRTRPAPSRSPNRIVFIVGASSLLLGVVAVALLVSLRPAAPDEAASSVPFSMPASPNPAKPGGEPQAPATPPPEPPSPATNPPAQPQPTPAQSPKTHPSAAPAQSSTSSPANPWGVPPWPTIPSALPQIPSTFPTLPSAFPPLPGLPSTGTSTGE